MGYYVNLLRTQIRIPESLFPVICKHLRESAFLDSRNMNGGCFGGPDDGAKWFSWCDMIALSEALRNNDLPKVFECFRFDVYFGDDKTINDLGFDCKIGDEETLFKYIADVLPGVHRLDWQGEDGSIWRWKISDNKLTSIAGRTMFPGDVV